MKVKTLIMIWIITCLIGQANAVLFSVCHHHQEQQIQTSQYQQRHIEKVKPHQTLSMHHMQRTTHANIDTLYHHPDKSECCGKTFCQCMNHACGVSGSSAALAYLPLPEIKASNSKIHTLFDSWTAIPRAHLLHVPIV
jgi:hypothetical protein